MTKIDEHSGAWRRDCFPALGTTGQRELIYLDSATTTLLPSRVIDAITDALSNCAGAHRSTHRIGTVATEQYEHSRAAIARHVGVSADELVFVRSATEGVNMIAEGWASRRVGPGDEICVSRSEHHSNLLPWRRVCDRRGARCVVIECDARGDIDLDDLASKLSPRTKLIALTHVSNVTGATTPVADVASILRRSAATDARLFVDGAQAIANLALDLPRLGCDFYTFSAHKAYGPPGIGALWARGDRWAEVEPFLLGGGMVNAVSDDCAEYASGIQRFEAGTPNVPAAVGFAAGLDFVAEHQERSPVARLTLDAADRLNATAGVHLLGHPRQRLGAVSFVVDGIHAHDVAAIADSHGVALRAGQHCAEPLLAHFGVTNSVRASFGLYNIAADIDALIELIEAAQSTFHSTQAPIHR